jgi:hypothetical protein
VQGGAATQPMVDSRSNVLLLPEKQIAISSGIHIDYTYQNSLFFVECEPLDLRNCVTISLLMISSEII